MDNTLELPGIKNLKESLSYDDKSGVFKWIKKMRGIRLNAVAGSKRLNSKSGKIYSVIGFNGKHYYAHRLAWLYMNGTAPDSQIDHIDGNGTNNSISNLRLATASENQRNMRLQSRNASGFTGVHFFNQTKKWRAVISINGKNVHLGLYKNKEDAIKTRVEANKEYGFHENHGQKRSL